MKKKGKGEENGTIKLQMGKKKEKEKKQWIIQRRKWKYKWRYREKEYQKYVDNYVKIIYIVILDTKKPDIDSGRSCIRIQKAKIAIII